MTKNEREENGTSKEGENKTKKENKILIQKPSN
jgi:hypothetical protein